jgi:hypothetical protein
VKVSSHSPSANTHQHLERVLVKKIALVLMSLVSSAAVAEPVLIGTTRLSQSLDASSIRVNSCRPDEWVRIAAIQIRAVNNSAVLQQVQVQYGNLNIDTIDLRQTLAPGQATGWIDLSRRGNCVLAIRVLGSSRAPQLYRATIDVIGMRNLRDMRDRRDEMPAPPMRPLPPPPPIRDDRGGWGRDDGRGPIGGDRGGWGPPRDDGRGPMRDDRGQSGPPRDDRSGWAPDDGRGPMRDNRGQSAPPDDVRGGIQQAPPGIAAASRAATRSRW